MATSPGNLAAEAEATNKTVQIHLMRLNFEIRLKFKSEYINREKEAYKFHDEDRRTTGFCLVFSSETSSTLYMLDRPK